MFASFQSEKGRRHTPLCRTASEIVPLGAQCELRQSWCRLAFSVRVCNRIETRKTINLISRKNECRIDRVGRESFSTDCWPVLPLFELGWEFIPHRASSNVSCVCAVFGDINLKDAYMLCGSAPGVDVC